MPSPFESDVRDYMAGFIAGGIIANYPEQAGPDIGTIAYAGADIMIAERDARGVAAPSVKKIQPQDRCATEALRAIMDNRAIWSGPGVTAGLTNTTSAALATICYDIADAVIAAS